MVRFGATIRRFELLPCWTSIRSSSLKFIAAEEVAGRILTTYTAATTTSATSGIAIRKRLLPFLALPSRERATTCPHLSRNSAVLVLPQHSLLVSVSEQLQEWA